MSKVDEIKEDLQIAGDLAAFADSKGAEQLVKALTSDVISSIETLIAQRDTLTLQGFIAIACDIHTQLHVIRSIKRAPKNKLQLADLLKEALQE